MMEEVIVLFAFGELQLDMPAISAVYIIAGTLELILQNTILLKWIDGTSTANLPKMRCRAMLAYAVPFALIPFCTFKGQPRWWQIASLGSLVGIRSSIWYVFTVTNTALRNAASRHSVGITTGWSTSVNGVACIVGPAVGTVAFAWSEQGKHSSIVNHHFTFWCAAIAAICLASFA